MCTLACAESCGATIGNSAVAARLFGPLVAGALSLSFTLPPWKALHALPELRQSPYDPNLMMGETISLALVSMHLASMFAGFLTNYSSPLLA